MAARSKWPDAKVAALIKRHAGILSLVGEEMGCTRQNVAQRVKNSAILTEAVKEVRERTKDLAEGTVLQAIQGDKAKGVTPDLATARWYLERQGKDRGFANKTETSFDEAQIEAIVVSLGGSPTALRAALVSLGAPPEQD